MDHVRIRVARVIPSVVSFHIKCTEPVLLPLWRAAICSRMRLLDLGCGSGWKQLIEELPRVVKIARKHFADLTVLQSTIETMTNVDSSTAQSTLSVFDWSNRARSLYDTALIAYVERRDTESILPL
jgi:hypothetical protein